MRQGLTLSTIIFHLYVEKPKNELNEKSTASIKIQGKKISMPCLAEDIALLSLSKQEPEKALSEMDEILTENYDNQ